MHFITHTSPAGLIRWTNHRYFSPPSWSSDCPAYASGVVISGGHCGGQRLTIWTMTSAQRGHTSRDTPARVRPSGLVNFTSLTPRPLFPSFRGTMLVRITHSKPLIQWWVNVYDVGPPLNQLLLLLHNLCGRGLDLWLFNRYQLVQHPASSPWIKALQMLTDILFKSAFTKMGLLRLCKQLNG